MAAVNAPLGQLVELVGMSAALRLVERFGGTCIYLPHPSRVKLHSPLAMALGLEPVKKLAGTWPQSHVMVPRGRGVTSLRRRRDRAILEDFRTLSVAQIARKYEMTERNVYMVLERGPEGLPGTPGAGGAQGDLFSAE